jgi:hypothetical protein
LAKTVAKMNRALDVLLSSPYVGSLAPDHLADLRLSGRWDETIRLHRLRSVSVHILPQLLGFNVAAIRSAMLLPFPHPRGGVMNHVRLKVFPPFTSARGDTVKYLQPRRSGVRLFFRMAPLRDVLEGDAPLWVVDGGEEGAGGHPVGPARGCLQRHGRLDGWRARGSRDAG